MTATRDQQASGDAPAHDPVACLQLVFGRGERQQLQPPAEQHDRALGLRVAHPDEAERHPGQKAPVGAGQPLQIHGGPQIPQRRLRQAHLGSLDRAHRAGALVFGGVVFQVRDRGGLHISQATDRRSPTPAADGRREDRVHAELADCEIVGAAWCPHLLICNVRERRAHEPAYRRASRAGGAGGAGAERGVVGGAARGVDRSRARQRVAELSARLADVSLAVASLARVEDEARLTHEAPSTPRARVHLRRWRDRARPDAETPCGACGAGVCSHAPMREESRGGSSILE